MADHVDREQLTFVSRTEKAIETGHLARRSGKKDGPAVSEKLANVGKRSSDLTLDVFRTAEPKHFRFSFDGDVTD